MRSRSERRVEEVEGEPGRYLVESSREDIGAHLVDMTENDGRGWCGCEDFEFRRQPKLVRGDRKTDGCRHIAAARKYELTKHEDDQKRNAGDRD